jgi:hypothetical protein
VVTNGLKQVLFFVPARDEKINMTHVAMDGDPSLTHPRLKAAKAHVMVTKHRRVNSWRVTGGAWEGVRSHLKWLLQMVCLVLTREHYRTLSIVINHAI